MSTAARQPARLTRAWLAVSLGMLAVAGLVGVLSGPARMGWSGVLRELAGGLTGLDLASGLTPQQATILWELRLPRVVLGALVGATLASAGAAYQGVFRNPLADPYLLGAAAGAGLGATVAIAYGPGSSLVPPAAFLGALVAVGATYALGRTLGGRTTSSLILAGVAMASFLTAVQTYVLQRESDTLQEVYGWILGRLSTLGWSEVLLILPYTLVSGAVILLHRRLVDVLGVGDEEAASLGVRPGLVRTVVVAAATLGTAAAVAVSGLIAFVGIIVPHTVALLAGTSRRVVLPLSFLVGGAFLVVADVLARTISAPAEIPIGVITAFFGAPFFALVLRTSRAGS